MQSTGILIARLSGYPMRANCGAISACLMIPIRLTAIRKRTTSPLTILPVHTSLVEDGTAVEPAAIRFPPRVESDCLAFRHLLWYQSQAQRRELASGWELPPPGEGLGPRQVLDQLIQSSFEALLHGLVAIPECLAFFRRCVDGNAFKHHGCLARIFAQGQNVQNLQ